MVTSPHHLASEAGLRVLREGGNAIEATVAMAATLAVVYPHMTSIGGDGFWLIAPRRRAAARLRRLRRRSQLRPRRFVRVAAATPRSRGADRSRPIPSPARSPAGAPPWRSRRRSAASCRCSAWSRTRSGHGENGFAVTASQQELTETKLPELKDAPNFAATFLIDGQPPREGEAMKLPALAARCAHREQGPTDFYRGGWRGRSRPTLRAASRRSRLTTSRAHRAQRRAPLSVGVKGARLFNLPPPTQGLASLMILALFERLGVTRGRRLRPRHGLVEATKQAFIVRDRIIGDPASMTERRRGLPRRGDARPAGRAHRPQARAALAACGAAGRHHLARRHRRQRPRGQLHPEHLLRVRLGLRAARTPASSGRTAARVSRSTARGRA